jgi:hypothetical protein
VSTCLPASPPPLALGLEGTRPARLLPKLRPAGTPSLRGLVLNPAPGGRVRAAGHGPRLAPPSRAQVRPWG